jgi:hypothetical protein
VHLGLSIAERAYVLTQGSIAERAYVLTQGSIALTGTAAELRDNTSLLHASYLGAVENHERTTS